MARAKPPAVATANAHLFVQAFPRLSLWLRLIPAVVRLIGAAARRLWPWRRELTVVTVLVVVWHLCNRLHPTGLALAVYLVLVGGVAGWCPPPFWVPMTASVWVGMVGC